jgi:hypothetical protein
LAPKRIRRRWASSSSLSDFPLIPDNPATPTKHRPA